MSIEIFQGNVAKFGGSSMAQPEVVGSILCASPNQWPMVVVSAPGKTPIHDQKQTPMLLRLDALKDSESSIAEEIIAGEVERMEYLYENLISRRDLGELNDWTRNMLRYFSRYDGMVAAIGEAASAKYFAKSIDTEAFVPLTGDRYNWQDFPIALNSRGGIDHELSIERSQALARRFGRLIIPGFMVFDVNGNLTTLPRGGSDETGGILAASLRRNYDNFTDVNGVFSADPRIVSTAIQRPEVTLEEARANAVAGTEVLQGDTILDILTISRLLSSDPIETTVRNTQDPNGQRSLLTNSRDSTEDPSPVRFIGNQTLTEFTVTDLGKSDTFGWINSLTKSFGGVLNIQHMATGRDGVTFIVSTPKDMDVTCGALSALQRELSCIGSISRPSASAVVTLVGDKLKNAPDFMEVTASALNILKDCGVDVHSNFRQPQTASIALNVSVEQGETAICALHDGLVS